MIEECATVAKGTWVEGLQALLFVAGIFGMIIITLVIGILAVSWAIDRTS